jgi:hypothetical protein
VVADWQLTNNRGGAAGVTAKTKPASDNEEDGPSAVVTMFVMQYGCAVGPGRLENAWAVAEVYGPSIPTRVPSDVGKAHSIAAGTPGPTRAFTPSCDSAVLRAPLDLLCAAVRIRLVPIYGRSPHFGYGSFGIKVRRNSLKLFVPCHHPTLCAPPLRPAPNRRDSMVTSESTPCSAHHGLVPCF